MILNYHWPSTFPWFVAFTSSQKKWPVEVAVNKKKANSYKLYNPESFHIMHNYKSDKRVGVKMTRAVLHISAN